MNKRTLRKRDRMNDLVEDTAAHYNSDNRSFDTNSNKCEYLPTKTSEGCAIGRWLSKGDQKKVADNDWNNKSVRELGRMDGPELNMSKFRGLPLEFLTSLQKLHDTKPYWDCLGLSEQGTAQKNRILLSIKAGSFDQSGRFFD